MTTVAVFLCNVGGIITIENYLNTMDMLGENFNGDFYTYKNQNK